ncbi:MAG: ABC transporter substrate-binding protein [Leptolyngbyaceae cyanobacterium MO_188.B28]|nr:ABC transporter substrate-binding protein [Leptolyngbyaceae cyanobacterium MO_188.B28]
MFKLSRLQSWFWLILLSFSLMLGSCQAQPKGNRDRVHLTLWQGVSPPSNREVFQSLVERFNQSHANIQVESLYVGQPDQQIPKILTAVVGDAAPDLLWYVPSITGQLVELEAIQPLDDWWRQSPLKEQIDPALFETMTMEGRIWSIPFATNNAAIFYRPSLFEAAGITHPPQTWEELRQAAKQLTQDTDGDGQIDQHGIFLSLGKGEWTVFVWMPFVFSAGGRLNLKNQPDLVNPGTLAALQLGATLVQDGSATLSSPERGYEIDNFLAGKAAMQVTGPWTLPQMEQAGIDFDAFPFPILGTPAAVVGGENIFLCKTTPERTEAALEFLDYILSEDFQLAWALGTGYLPVNLEVRNSETYQAFVAQHPPLEVFLKQMEWARARPLIPGYTHLSENFGRAIEASLLGQSPESALKKAQARLELIWAK